MPKKNNNKKKQKKQHNKKKVVAPARDAANQEENENLKIYEDDIQKTIQRLSLAEGEEDPTEKNLFQLYYDERRREEEKLDIDKYQEVLELECYNGWNKTEIAVYEMLTINGINIKREKKSKKPITFHKDKNAEIDITLEEIEEELRPTFPPNTDPAQKIRNLSSMAKCMYDYLEEKYKQNPLRDEYGSSEEEPDATIEVMLNEDVTIEKMEKLARKFDNKFKKIGMNGCPDRLILAIRMRDGYIKGGRLLKQLEKLKEYKKSCPEYKDRLNTWIDGSGLVIKTTLSGIYMDSLDEMVDECYQIMMKKRKEKGKPPLTLHKIGGKFDLQIEEVQKAACVLRAQELEPENAVFKNIRTAFVLYNQFEIRVDFIKKAEQRMNDAGLFKKYYEQKEREEEKLDLDAHRERIEQECYADFTKDQMIPIAILSINEINERRSKRGKKPIMFHENENADFDITLEEIEEQLRHKMKFNQSEPLESATRAYKIPPMAKCMYDYMEEKYKLMPELEKAECADKDDKDDLCCVMYDFSLKDLEKSLKCLHYKARTIGMFWTETEKENMNKRGNVLIKAIRLMRQVEKLKEYKKSCPDYRGKLEALIKFVNSVIKMKMGYIVSTEEKDKVVDEFYPFLIEQRKISGKPPLTIHTIGGDVEQDVLDDIEEAVKLYRKSGPKEMLTRMGEYHFVTAMLQQLIRRSMMVEKSAQTTNRCCIS